VRIRIAPVIAGVLAALVAAPVAAAHVTLNPREWEAGGFAKFDVRVPNERDEGDTTKVVMQFPPEVIDAGFQPTPGWDFSVKMAPLDEPIDDEGEQITERIDTVTWTGGRIRPGEFQEFGVSFQVPEDAAPGTALAFPSVQTYSNPNETVRWIGPEESDEPAPTVTVLEAPPEEGAAAEPAATPTPAPAQPAAEEDEGGSDTLSIIALIVGIAGLAAGLAAFFTRRRQPQPVSPAMKEEEPAIR
jgi:periplasmic copper chaperone A